MKSITDNLWTKLYWPKEYTRPDQLANILNSIISQDEDDSPVFIYRQPIANYIISSSQTHLTYQDKVRLIKLNNRLQSDSYEETNWTRSEIDKVLGEYFDSVFLSETSIEPRTINGLLVNFGQLSEKKQLASMNTSDDDPLNSFKLPIRCKPNENDTDDETQTQVINRIARLENLLKNITDQVRTLYAFCV